MNPFLLLFIGMAVVLGGILILRLNPVLALIIGALAVGGLTTMDYLELYGTGQNLSEDELNTLLNQPLGKRIAIAFGNTCGKVGLLIALASIIGKCLLESGAAERIVRTIVKLLGEKKAPASFMYSSFLLGIPVYADTVFYLMIPLARAMGVRNKEKYALYIMAIIAGSVMAHSLVPPTPGPLFMAGELGISIGLMIIVGLAVGVISSMSGLLYGYWLNKRQTIPIRDTADTSIDKLESLAKKDSTDIPPIFVSLLPILLPVILISGNTIISNLNSEVLANLAKFFHIFGDPIIALFIATIISLALLLNQYKWRLREMGKPVQDALLSGGMIILITASGGAFGAMLQQTGIGYLLSDIAPNYKFAILPMAFVLTAIIRTAQGSATVAMITASGILSAFASTGNLDFHPVYLACAIGCGSKLIPWMNDSGFWIACKMSGFTEAENIRNYSFLLTIMGIMGLIATMIFAKLFPLI